MARSYPRRRRRRPGRRPPDRYKSREGSGGGYRGGFTGYGFRHLYDLILPRHHWRPHFNRLASQLVVTCGYVGGVVGLVHGGLLGAFVGLALGFVLAAWLMERGRFYRP